MSLISLVIDICIISAAVGLCSSLIVHLIGFFNNSERLNGISTTLSKRIFWVYPPAVIIASQITADYPAKEFGEIIFINCPEWMKYETYFFIYYGTFWLVIFMIKSTWPCFKRNPLESDRSNPQLFNIDRIILSVINMMFYAGALAIYYSGLQVYG